MNTEIGGKTDGLKWYILRGHKIETVPNAETWGAWMASNDVHLAVDMVGDVKVSTVFLGVDASAGLEAEPVLFETMVCGGKYDGFQARECSALMALAAHKATVKMVQGARR